MQVNGRIPVARKTSRQQGSSVNHIDKIHILEIEF